MCGIAGVLDLKGRVPERLVLERMCDALAHRGPDDAGYYLQGAAALGQRRLSIIDLATGKQPMSNEDGTVWVVFNGEIYNYQELRSRLEGLGHRFATRSDTEVIVHAFEQFGRACLTYLRGMFALAIWSELDRILFLARDRVGKKPLFYAEVGGQFVFASELQGLLAHPAVPRRVEPTALDDYLTYGYVPAPKTAFDGIFKLPPAHYLFLQLAPDGQGLKTRQQERFWSLAYGPKLVLDEEEAAAGLLEKLTEAVRLRMTADVPLGALLSGGIDSSLVVALMSQLSGQSVQTFSIGFDEQEFDELPYARLVARRYETDHHEFVVRPAALDVLPKLVRHYGEPFADSSALPSYYVAQLTRQHVTVALNGDGGDECLGGYERYLGGQLADRYVRLPQILRRVLLQPLAACVPSGMSQRNRLRQFKRFLQAAELPAGQRYLQWVGQFTAAARRALYVPEFQERLVNHDAESWFLDLFDQHHKDGLGGVDRLLAVDMQSYLSHDLLVKMDIATMANSLEARSPFLDHHVLEFAGRLPANMKVRGGRLKYLLKKIGRKLLPRPNVTRRKMGFGAPVGKWLRGDLRGWLEDLLLSPQAYGRRYFHLSKVRRLLQEHHRSEGDHGGKLWTLLWLELWHREFRPT